MGSMSKLLTAEKDNHEMTGATPPDVAPAGRNRPAGVEEGGGAPPLPLPPAVMLLQLRCCFGFTVVHISVWSRAPGQHICCSSSQQARR